MNVLLVDGDADFAAMLATDLRSLGHRVTLSDNGRAALRIAAQDAFDAVILNRVMPDMDGALVVRHLRERGQHLPVLMLATSGETADKIDGLDAGADDYVVKPASVLEIDARLKALVRARSWRGSDTDTLRSGDIVVSPGQVRAWRDGEPLNLTATEFRLLAELARHAGGFVTRAVLLARIWGYDVAPDTNIVDGHIKTLRRKLTAQGGADPIVTKRNVGYMLQA